MAKFARRAFHPLLFAAPLLIANADPQPAPPMMPKITPIPIAPSSANPPGMKVIASEDDGFAATYIPNVEYARRGDRQLRLQILQPRDAPPMMSAPGTAPPVPKRRPLIVYVQGSGWGPQDLYSAIPQLSELAHQGYVVASVEYSPSTVAQAPSQIQDVKTAIRFLRANAAKYGIDPARVGIWGDSSGGHMAALVGTTAGVAAFKTDDFADQQDSVSAVVDFYGVSDLTTMGKYPSWMDHDAEGSPGALMLGVAPPKDPAKARAHSPVAYIARDRRVPPFLLMHGDVDVIVPFNQSVELYEKLRAAGKDVTLYKMTGGNHGFRFWSPTVIRIVTDFFDKHLAAPADDASMTTKQGEAR